MTSTWEMVTAWDEFLLNSACGEACGPPDHRHRLQALGSRRAPWSTLEKPAAWKQAKAMSTRQQRCVGPSGEPGTALHAGAEQCGQCDVGSTEKSSQVVVGDSPPGGRGQGL